MPLTIALIGASLMLAQEPPSVTWASLKAGKEGSWSVKATYPVLKGSSPLVAYFNRELKWLVKSHFDESSAKQQTASLKGVLSVVSSRFISVLVTHECPGKATDLYPLSVWLNGNQPLRCGWGSIVKAGSNADRFTEELLLPVLNSMRSSSKMDPLKEFPPGLLDGFVQTKSNVSWIAPPGTAGLDAQQIKVPIDDLRRWLDPRGALAHLVKREGGVKIPVRIVVTWLTREALPTGSILRVSLSRERNDPDPLAMQDFPIQDPPMDVKFDFEGILAEEDERLYLDLKIVSRGETLFRNRNAERIPVLGWQTVHEIKLDRDR